MANDQSSYIPIEKVILSAKNTEQRLWQAREKMLKTAKSVDLVTDILPVVGLAMLANYLDVTKDPILNLALGGTTGYFLRPVFSNALNAIDKWSNGYTYSTWDFAHPVTQIASTALGMYLGEKLGVNPWVTKFGAAFIGELLRQASYWAREHFTR